MVDGKIGQGGECGSREVWFVPGGGWGARGALYYNILYYLIVPFVRLRRVWRDLVVVRKLCDLAAIEV